MILASSSKVITSIPSILVRLPGLVTVRRARNAASLSMMCIDTSSAVRSRFSKRVYSLRIASWPCRTPPPTGSSTVASRCVQRGQLVGAARREQLDVAVDGVGDRWHQTSTDRGRCYTDRIVAEAVPGAP